VTPAAPSRPDAPESGPLVGPEALVGLLGEVCLLDVRWQLGRDDGRARHEEAHLPGAAYVDLEQDLADPPHTGTGGRHPLPDPERFGEAMRRCGVRGTVPVVVYDDVGGTSAARAWWLLRHHGHPAVRVLDGGLAAWRAAGCPLDSGPVRPAYGDFTPGPGVLPVLDAAGAAELARHGVLYDARVPGRFRGEQEPVDPVAGHIPGAVNLPGGRNLVEEGGSAGRFRPRAELAAAYHLALTPGARVGAYCGSGVTAAHTVLALEVLGVRASLYAGSWSDWVSDPRRPVQTG
jgi:thiosulfate/3-mercaptopyruvate sulfurtransferase